MRYRKLSLLLVLSLVFLLLISFGLICTWFYYYFYNKKDETVTGHYESYDSLTANQTRDSLNKVYTATINDFDHSNDSLLGHPDSLKANLDSKFMEYTRLKKEISGLLGENSSVEELDTARVKISILQQRIEDLRSRTKAVENENRRLSEMVRQLNARLQDGKGERSNPANVFPSRKEPAVSDENLTAFVASDLKLTEEKEETGARLTGSFTVKNSQSVNGTEIYVVVLQPNGRTLLNSDWETGSFSISNGRRIYSVRIPLDYNKGENRRLSFSIHTDDPQKGTYTMEVYHAGKMVGKYSFSVE